MKRTKEAEKVKSAVARNLVQRGFTRNTEKSDDDSHSGTDSESPEREEAPEGENPFVQSVKKQRKGRRDGSNSEDEVAAEDDFSAEDEPGGENDDNEENEAGAGWTSGLPLPVTLGPDDWPLLRAHAQERAQICIQLQEAEFDGMGQASLYRADKELEIVRVPANTNTSRLGVCEAEEILSEIDAVNPGNAGTRYPDEDKWEAARTDIEQLKQAWINAVTALKDAIPAPGPWSLQQLQQLVNDHKDQLMPTVATTVNNDGCEDRAHAICEQLVKFEVPEGRVHKRWVQRRDRQVPIHAEHNRWKWHVAAAVQTDTDEYILDPFLAPDGPTLLQTWHGMFVEQNSKFSSPKPRTRLELPDF